MIPTMTFIHVLTGKSSGILSDISSGILSGISSGISSGILSGKSSGILSGISSGILSDISSGILSGISSGILPGISSGICSGISSDILSGISSDILSDILSGILSGISSDILSDIFSDILPVEVRQCPLRSGSRGWGPAVPTGIWSSRLRSGSAHWDLELAVEVRQCPLQPGSRGWGPAVRLRSGSAHWDLDCEEEEDEEEEEDAEAEEEENSSDKISQPSPGRRGTKSTHKLIQKLKGQKQLIQKQKWFKSWKVLLRQLLWTQMVSLEETNQKWARTGISREHNQRCGDFNDLSVKQCDFKTGVTNVTGSCRFPATFIAYKCWNIARAHHTQKPKVTTDNDGMPGGSGSTWSTVLDPECTSFTTIFWD